MNASEVAALVSSTLAWLTRLRIFWRERWAEASEAERAEASGCLLKLDAPLRIHAYLRAAGRVPIQVAVLRLSSSPVDALAVSVIGDNGIEGGDGHLEASFLDQAETLHGIATRGWSPGRTVVPHRAGAVRLDDGSTYEVVGDLTAGLADSIVADCFRVRGPSVPPAEQLVEHTYDMNLREPELVRRVLASRAEHVVSRLGIGAGTQHVKSDVTVVGYWLGLFIPRHRLFGGPPDGDLDLIAGLNTVPIAPERWNEFVDEETRRLPMGLHRSNAEAIVANRACAQGKLVWPPNESYIIGAETKVSRFGPSDDDPEWRWHGTRENDGPAVAGQLSVHWKQGIARASYWHLGVTAPAPFFWPHVNATSAASDSFPEVEFNDERFGHFAEVVGAVTGRSEADAGSHTFKVEHPPAENPNWLVVPWWREFQAAVGALPSPRAPYFFVAVCEHCAAWFHSYFPSAVCAGCRNAAV